MGDRPIIFSALMVRALLAGRKTQTRRIVKPQPELQSNGYWHVSCAGGGMVNVRQQDIAAEQVDYLPWAPGDQLWVREAWRLPTVFDETSPTAFVEDLNSADLREGPNGLVRFEADGCDAWGMHSEARPYLGRLRPSIHLPQRLSRLTLFVTDVRVERLQDISDVDAIDEGAMCVSLETLGPPSERGRPPLGQGPRYRFRHLWNSLHGDEAWNSNPWAAAISFDVHHRNIDACIQPTPAAAVEEIRG